MSFPAKKFKPVRFCLCVLVVAVAGGAALGLVGRHLWRSPTSPAQVAPVAVKPPVSAVTTSATSATSTTSGSSASALLASATPSASSTSSPSSADALRPAMPLLPVAGNLAIITSKRATLAEKKLQKELDDLEARSAGSSQAGSPAVVFAPDNVADDVAKMLEAPAIKPETAPARAASTTVVAVQGVDGKLTATLRHNGKLITLEAGEKFAGGTVAAISRQGVTLRSQHGVQSLSFE